MTGSLWRETNDVNKLTTTSAILYIGGARIRGLAGGFASWEGRTGLFGMGTAFGSGCPFEDSEWYGDGLGCDEVPCRLVLVW